MPVSGALGDGTEQSAEPGKLWRCCLDVDDEVLLRCSMGDSRSVLGDGSEAVVSLDTESEALIKSSVSVSVCGSIPL